MKIKIYLAIVLIAVVIASGCLNKDVATNKYPSVSKIGVKFEDYRLNFAPANNINSAYGSLQIKNDNDYNIVVKLKCDTSGVPNIGCEETTQGEAAHWEVTEIEGRKIDGDIIQPHENKLLSFKVYATSYPISTGNFMLKVRVFVDDKCPYYIIGKDGYSSTCSSEQNDYLIDESPVYLTIN